ncbi:MAG: hypothetical protein WBF05_06425, partial [Anaerolineales bacterium]
MKRFISIIILISMTLTACSTEPSDSSVKTAIAKTQSAKPTNTTKPTDKPKPTDSPKLTATNTPEPTTTETPVPTETSIPPTPTIEPYIVYPRCNCSEIVKQGDNFVARLRWGATTKAFAEEGSDVIRYTMKINGEEVKDLDSHRRPAVYEKDPFGDSELWWVYWDYP